MDNENQTADADATTVDEAGTSDETNQGPTAEEVEAAEMLENLKARADTLGVEYSPKLKDPTKLSAKIDAHLEALEAAKEGGSADDKGEKEKPEKASKGPTLREKIRRDALRLHRVHVICNNPNKNDLDGEIFTVGNKYTGAIRKFIPYGEGSENGWHVPHILLENLRGRKYLSVTTKQLKTGEMDIKQRWVPEFNIIELPPLTEEEMADLKHQQALQKAAG